VHRLERDQTLGHHLVQKRKELLDLALEVHDLDHHGEVFREPQDLCGVDVGVGAEAHRTAQHGGARQASLARGEHDRLVERFPMPTVRLPDEDP
jgi:hypothetical protein